MADVFISCAAEDEAVASAVSNALESRGFKAWYPLRDGVPGVSYQTQVDEAIGEASCLVLLISQRSIDSPQVNREFLRARENGKDILPILLDLTEGELAGAKPEWVRLLGDTVIARWQSAGLEEIIDTVARGLDAVAVRALLTRTTPSAPVKFLPERSHASEPPVGRSFRVTGRLVRRILQPRHELRVAFSAVIRIAHGDHYLLIRNLHRQESFAPIGGVYKYRPSAVPMLDSFGFRPQSVGPGDDMLRDLRGFLPMRNLRGMLHWFNERLDRESGSECLTREFREEMAESDIWTAIHSPKEMIVRHVRRVEEGPEKIPGQRYLQYRVFDVFELCESPEASKLRAQLFAVSKNSDNLLTATSSQIISGRAGRSALVGHHAAYLFGEKRYRHELPVFLENGSRVGGHGSR